MTRSKRDDEGKLFNSLFPTRLATTKPEDIWPEIHMDDPWDLLRSAMIDVLDPLWYEYAKEGKESAVLAPLAQYPDAGAWLAAYLSMSADCTTRKLGAMLAGWIQDPKHVALLPEMLGRERQVFREDNLSANSVGEDIMFAATRWTESKNSQITNAGIQVLASMIKDALDDIPWNTVHWAVANLHAATQGTHAIFRELAGIPEAQIKGQSFLQSVVRALRQKDAQAIARFRTPPSQLYSLSSNDPDYSTVCALWNAAAAAAENASS